MERATEQQSYPTRSRASLRALRWSRVVLLCVLAYEALGAFLGGILLVVAPDGHLMEMSVSLMHGFFPDFLIPGIMLLAIGIVNAVAFVAVVLKSRAAWGAAFLGLGILVIWFIAEIWILRELHWLHLMWGLPVYAGLIATVPLLPPEYLSTRKLLLICGILSSLLYVAMNFVVPLEWPGYDSASQVVSELSAVGAPSRPVWVWLGIIYTILVTAFAWGVVKSAGENRRLRTAGMLLVMYGGLGIFWPFAPMHLRETLAAGGGTLSDSLHIAFGAITEVIYLLALGFAAISFGKKFLVYSASTFAVLFVFGVLSFKDAPALALNQPTPLIGVWERINIGVFLLWVVVLSILLLRGGREKRVSPSK